MQSIRNLRAAVTVALPLTLGVATALAAEADVQYEWANQDENGTITFVERGSAAPTLGVLTLGPAPIRYEAAGWDDNGVTSFMAVRSSELVLAAQLLAPSATRYQAVSADDNGLFQFEPIP
jgi:hypothetical protein